MGVGLVAFEKPCPGPAANIPVGDNNTRGVAGTLLLRQEREVRRSNRPDDGKDAAS